MKKFYPFLFLASLFFVGAGCSAGDRVPGANTNTNANLPSQAEVLDLSNRGLTKVSMDIFDRAWLTELNLSGNNLTGALPAEVRKLRNLEVLNLSGNQFTGVPAEIGQLEKLLILDLSNNKLTGLPYELGNLTGLQTLDVSGNDYSEADLEKIRSTLPNTRIIE